MAANRDEYLDRPAEGPAVRRTQAGAVIAPLDVRAGGTWLGLGGAGVFAALTNLRNPNPDPTRKSRGLVVMEALESTSAEAAAMKMERLPKAAYNPFNCFVADKDRAFLAVYHEAARLHELEPGVHVIGNVDAAEAAIPKIGRVLEQARAAAELPGELVLDALAEICGEHGSGTNPLDDTCVHAGGTYGTRSSILLELNGDLDRGRILYADGPPCRTKYEDFSSLLHELRQMSGYGEAEIPTRTAS